MYSINEMVQLAQNYLQRVGESPVRYPSVDHLLQHTVDVYKARLDQGLEVKLNKESGVFE